MGKNTIGRGQNTTTALSYRPPTPESYEDRPMIDIRLFYCKNCAKKTKHRAVSDQKGTATLRCNTCGREEYHKKVRTMKCACCGNILTPHTVKETTIICLRCGTDNTEATKW